MGIIIQRNKTHMFTFYAEIPTKNLTIEVPTFSEDQEAFSTYSPAEIDASFDF